MERGRGSILRTHVRAAARRLLEDGPLPLINVMPYHLITYPWLFWVWCGLLCAPLGCEVRLHLFPACVVRLLPDVGCGARLWLLFAFCVACVRVEAVSLDL